MFENLRVAAGSAFRVLSWLDRLVSVISVDNEVDESGVAVSS
jgi:hypothetical protein